VTREAQDATVATSEEDSDKLEPDQPCHRRVTPSRRIGAEDLLSNYAGPVPAPCDPLPDLPVGAEHKVWRA
jgi:hypothetical protein